jgi:hypothetical protein
LQMTQKNLQNPKIYKWKTRWFCSFCSLDEAGGAGAEPPQSLQLPPHQRSRFCRRMERTLAGLDEILFPVVGSAMARQKPACQGFEGGDLRSKYYPALDWQDRRSICCGNRLPHYLFGGFNSKGRRKPKIGSKHHTAFLSLNLQNPPKIIFGYNFHALCPRAQRPD